MIFTLDFHFTYFYTNLIVFTLLTLISTIAKDVQKCTIGVLDDCPQSYTCVEINGQIGECRCRDVCPQNDTIVSTVRPLPIYSDDNSSDSSSVIITSIFGSIFVLLIMSSAYYFGIRKGLFQDIWRRTFTPRQIEHQLLDRSPTNDDNNDSEAIA